MQAEFSRKKLRLVILYNVDPVFIQPALLHWLAWTKHGKPIQVAFPYANRLWGTAFWWRQLWAELPGKAKNRKGRTINAGQTSVAALGKVFTFGLMGRKGYEEYQAKYEAYEKQRAGAKL